ncbi:MAG: alkaline phosphatase [Lewinella sp.]|nr:alkaline phosphatase [Lewinella sp.]
MIGDGMGLGQITAGMYSNGNQLNLEKFPVVGFHKTHSANDLVTDSAAGATAFACGIKTYNSAIGISADSMPCYTILEEARDRGLATGLVVSSQITNATPAAFVAHQTLRGMNESIAADLVKADVDFFIGGGLSYFTARSLDNRNLRQELADNGYLVYDYKQGSVHRVPLDIHKKFAYFSAENLPPGVNLGRNYLPYSGQLAAQFLEKRSDKGFFLMIEGSQIDWAGHSNDASWMIKEMLDFDRTIGLILDFAKKRGNTLVIVTADHETGGTAINDRSKMDRVRLDFTTNHHTAAMVPVFAYGPGARSFAGIYDNTQIYYKMKAALGWNDSPLRPGRQLEGSRN